jgi:hypothetical protein
LVFIGSSAARCVDEGLFEWMVSQPREEKFARASANNAAHIWSAAHRVDVGPTKQADERESRS